MSILDALNSALSTGDPERDAANSRGLLMAGLQLMGARGKLMPALSQAGMTGVQSADMMRRQQQQEQLQKMQSQMAKYQLSSAQRESEIASLPGQFFNQPAPPAVDATGGMETAVEAPNNVSLGNNDMQGYITALRGKDPAKAAAFESMLVRQPPKLEALKEGESGYVFNPALGKYELQVSGAPKDNRSNEMKLYDAAVKQGFKGTIFDFVRTLRRDGASKTEVSVNTGQKGFDNTLKLRGDFRSEPVYKAHQEMQSAYSQIQQALKQQSPAGDLAGATKIMKLLDPGSVVRESELGMAMAATGLLDRIENSAKLIISGQKLTPSQRESFQKLADALYSESVSQYNAKRTEYQGIASRNGLPEADVLGPASVSPIGQWSIKPKSQ